MQHNINVPPPSGYGPWCVQLSVNIHSTPCKKTQIRLHTYCGLILHAMNEDSCNEWVPIIEVGPFESWIAALVFKSDWEGSTRNYKNRVVKGWDLFNTYHEMYNLIMWYQPHNKLEHIHIEHPNLHSGDVRPMRKLARKYREMTYNGTQSRIPIHSIQKVERKRKCLGIKSK